MYVRFSNTGLVFDDTKPCPREAKENGCTRTSVREARKYPLQTTSLRHDIRVC